MSHRHGRGCYDWGRRDSLICKLVEVYDPGEHPDPLRHDDTDLDPRVPEPHRPVRSTDYAGDLGCWSIAAVVMVISLLLIAASRSGQTTAPIDVSRSSSAALSEAPPAQSSGRPTSLPVAELAGGASPSPTGDVGPGGPITGTPNDVTWQGIIAYADPSFGPRYLAIPKGPGILVRVCGPAACLNRLSTDAGPTLALQRAGRIADVSAADFQTICGVPLRFGTCPGSVTIERRAVLPTLPPTNTEETP